MKTPQHLLKYGRDYYYKNRDRILKEHREYHTRFANERNRKQRVYYSKNKDRARIYNRKYYQMNTEKVKKINNDYRTGLRKLGTYSLLQRKWALNKRYGISIENYDEILAKQKGVCAICGGKNKQARHRLSFTVDHCHKTNKIRGLLCRLCNVGLGSFRDNTGFLENAISYLKSHQLT